MFNSKRLIMMALAASMILPNHLTSILANESFVELNAQEENVFLETGTQTISLTQNDFTPPNPAYFTPIKTNDSTYYNLKSGNYELAANVEVSFVISIPKGNTVTIDLKSHTLTNKTTSDIFSIDGDFTLQSTNTEGTESTGKISHQITGLTGTTHASFIVQGKVTISGVEIENLNNDSVFQVMGNNNELKIENSSIVSKSGEGIKIPYFYGDIGPTVNLTNVTVKTPSTGIWQMYPSTINLENCMVESDRGIVSSIGTLNVSNSVIKNPNTTTASSALSTDKAGVYFFPNNQGALNGNIKNSVISGDIALLIAETESNSSQTRNIKVENTTLKGTSCDLGYVGNIPFTLKNVSLSQTDQQPEKLIFDGTPPQYASNQASLKKDTTSSTSVPYTIIPSTTQSEGVKVEIKNSSLKTLGTTNILTKEGQGEIESQLKTKAKEQTTSNNQITVYSLKNEQVTFTSSEATLNYTDYSVELTSPEFTKNETDNTYTFQALIKAKLQPNSIICLLIPFTLNTKTQVSEVTQNLETFFMLENEEMTTSPFHLYVELSEVLNNPNNISSGLNSQKIQKIFEGISENSDIALIDTTKLSEFEKIDLNQAFELKDIGEVIEINGSEKQVVSNTPTGGGGSSKPKPKPQEPAQEPTIPVGTPTSMYRLYNRLTGEHLYTTNKAERDALLTSDTWKDEGQGWTAPSVSDFPVYRLLNPNTGDHHYTTDKNEFETLPSYGWIAEGIAFFSADKDKEENVILHRIYNPNAQGAGSHHYTTDKNERDSLISQGWIDEGTAWAGLPTE